MDESMRSSSHLAGLGLSHTTTYFCHCGYSMMPRSFLSPSALVWDSPGAYHRGKTPVPAENWVFWDTSTQSAPKIPVPNPWKDQVPPHGYTSLPRKSSPAFGGHGRAKGRCRISISTRVGRAGGEERQQQAAPLTFASSGLLPLLLVLSNTDQNAALLPPWAAFCRHL